jgi:DNA-directed RNA polymerase subunit omega
MKKISIDELIQMVDSRYSLVTIISRRARQIIDGSDILIRTPTIKPVAIAIEEFYEGKYQPIYDYDQYKKNLEESVVSNELQADSEDTVHTEDQSNE